MYNDDDEKKNEFGFSVKLQRFMNTPGALFVQILWQFGMLILCGFSIWQIVRINTLDPPPNQPFMKLSYPDQSAKFRHGAVQKGLLTSHLNGIDAASQRRDMRVFLIVIVAFAVPFALLNLGKTIRLYNKVPPKTSDEKTNIDKCRDFILGIAGLGVFVTWIVGQVIYFHCIPSKYYNCLQYNFEIVTLTWIIWGYVSMFAPIGFMILHAVIYFGTRK